MRTAREIARIVKFAFGPFSCVTEVRYERELGFRVYESDGSEMYTQPLMAVSPLLDDEELKRFILRARAVVETRSGIKLNPWQLTT